MTRSLKRIWAVALLTGTEGLRQPAFFLLFITAAILTAFSPSFSFFHLGMPLVGAFWLAYSLASAFLLIFLAFKAPEKTVWDWRMIGGLVSIALHACVISAVAVALATRLTLVQSAIGTAAFFLLGHAS